MQLTRGAQQQRGAVILSDILRPTRLWLIPLALLILPTMVSVARQHWSTESGAHGPIILATGLWLLWRSRETIFEHRARSENWFWLLFLIPLLLIYAFARAYGVLFVETTALYMILLLLGLVYWGPRALRHVWFPILYMAFLIVPPGTIMTELTQPLKIWISSAAVELLYLLGFPVAHSGAVIYIAQYELLVETACAGLGSLLSLTAISLLYVHLRWQAGVARSALLMAAVVPIAIFANFVRVLLLVLMTYYAGDDVAQGFAHDFAGLLLFVVAMLGMFAADKLLSLQWRRPVEQTA